MEPAVELEERLTRMEAQLQSLQRIVEERLAPEKQKQKQGWHAIVGTFSEDPIYDEAMRLGRQWRDADYGDKAVEAPYPNSPIHFS